MASRFLELADILASDMQLFCRQFLPRTTVSRVYEPDIDDDAFDAWIDAQTPMGVYVVPAKKTSSIECRNSDLVNYQYAVVFAEKYTEAGQPTTKWMDARISLVDAVDDEYGDMRNARMTSDGNLLWAQEAEIALAYDPDVYRLNHAFMALWTVTLRESLKV